MGYGLFAGFMFGAVAIDVIKDIEKLEIRLIELTLHHSLSEELDMLKGKGDLLKNRKPLFDEIDGATFIINKKIKVLRKICKKLQLDHTIKAVDSKKIKKIIQGRYETISKGDETVNLKDENFRIKLHSYLIHEKVKDIGELWEIFKRREKVNGVQRLNDKYKQGITEAIHINSIGYPLTAIFVVGKTIETLLDDLLKKLMDNKRIKKLKLNQIKIVDKIGLLKNSKTITEKDWHDLTSITIGRNEAGHPETDKSLKKDIDYIIPKAIAIISRLQKKVK